MTGVRPIRFAFRVLYNPLAWAYDGVSQVVSRGRWRDWQRTSLPELRGRRVLELAFGTGNVLLDLHAAGYRPVGLELSPSMVRIARGKLRQRGIDLALVQGCAQELPFARASFDSLLCTFPAEFILAPGTLGEMARVLRVGGRGVVVALARLCGEDPWSRLLEWLYRVTGQRGPVPDLGPELASLGLEYRTVRKAVGDSEVLLALIEKQIDR